MVKLKSGIPAEQQQYVVYSTIAIVLLLMLVLSDRAPYERFIGSINPIWAFILLVMAGALFLSLLMAEGGFAIVKNKSAKGLLYAVMLSTLFFSIVIIADLIIVFPADINVPFPASLSFYPVIGFIVEIIFHIIPLGLLLFLNRSMGKPWGAEKIIGWGIFIVACLEPVYQTTALITVQQNTTGSVIFVAVHLFLINACQLLIFRKYDFVSMYTFRLCYYLLWHITWGHLRLRILF